MCRTKLNTTQVNEIGVDPNNVITEDILKELEEKDPDLFVGTISDSDIGGANLW